ncbi:MAG: penicillin-binding protein 2, partial [Thermoanaerobaculia bacterium]
AGELRRTLENARATPDFKPVLLAGALSLRQVARFRVEHLEHPEFEIASTQLRLYRHGHQTAHILGYLGEVTESDLAVRGARYRAGDTVGKSGVEGRYEAHLRGRRGEQVVVVDNRGQITGEFRRRAATPGGDLTLTIDLGLQQEAARQLAGKVGAIVVLDPRQGEVLALVSEPSFNPNRFARRMHPEEWRQVLDHPHHPLQNRAIQNAYPPGSVFKVVMALAGLDLGLVDPQRTVVTCRGFSRLYNHRYRCWHAGGHGRVDLRQSLKRSCNVFYHQLGLQIDVDQIAAYSRMFGLGHATGIDLAGEKSGLVPDRRWSLERRGAPWYPGETISVATGQGPLLVTPMQIAVMTAAIANGGRLVVPHLVRDPARDPAAVDSTLTKEISREHLQRVREAMWSVVNEARGTGVAARTPGIEIAGKTGTAQVVTQKTRTNNDELPFEHRDHAWFVSFAPADDPRLVVVVFVEHGGAGSRAAAPLAKPIYETFLDLDGHRPGPPA